MQMNEMTHSIAIQDFFARLGRLLVAKDSTGLRAMAKETYIDTVENQLPTYDSQTR